MLDTGYPKKALLCATILAAGGGGVTSPAVAGTPLGVFVSVDPSNSTELGLMAPGSAISSLFGTETCGTTCAGGVNGVFITEKWSEFQKTIYHATTNKTEIEIDHSGNLGTLMSNIGIYP